MAAAPGWIAKPAGGIAERDSSPLRRQQIDSNMTNSLDTMITFQRYM
jgi:hypothetical protein